MRLNKGEYELLKRVHSELITLGCEELAAQLQAVITRYEERREINRVLWRERDRVKREAGYIQRPPEKRPKKSKYYHSTQENTDAGIHSQD